MNQDSTRPGLPPRLLEAISSPGGGRVVLVLGAGCSKENPTGLPLAGELSQELHRKLVLDGILSEGDVEDQRNLSAVADAVFEKTGGQRDLIDRFPPDQFMNAKPNEGYLILAALLLEGALTDTLTLNFDLAARTALAQLGAGSAVSTVRGPEEHARIGARNLVYLHRDIDAPPDKIILRTAALEEAWREQWGEVVARRVLAAPITVFVGLGSPASVLVETTTRIADTVDPSQATVYVVDPGAHKDSRFAEALEVCPDRYLRMGWGDFMRALAQRVLEEHRAAVERNCHILAEELDLETEDVADLCERWAELGLPGLGQLRARWILDRRAYVPHEQGLTLNVVSELILAVRMVERGADRTAQFDEDGVVEFSRGTQATRVIVCSGCGQMSPAQIAAKLSSRDGARRSRGRAPLVALVAGVVDSGPIATPRNIVSDTDPTDLIPEPGQLRIINVANLRADPGLIAEVIA